MIKHIVMWRLKGTDELKVKHGQEIKERLENLKGKIEEIVTIEVGLNILKSDQAYDVVLYSEFDNLDALERYQIHPNHQEVVTFIKEVVEQRVVVDYEI